MSTSETTHTRNNKNIPAFKKNIRNFYRKNKREMPWRNTHDPYKILVSEVMLQQTQVSRVLKKYPQFIQAFPSPRVLAKTPLKRILSVWQGMGYNRRAIALKKIADKIMKEYSGVVPNDPVILEKFPGIGKNTAGAIIAFAFNKPAVFIETNIRRVFIYHFFKHRSEVSDKEILTLVEKTLDKKNPREWYYALMDYGAMLVRKVTNPNRRSKYYTKQKPFKGSNREVRGLIIQVLLENKSLSIKKFKEKINRPELPQNINDLVHEGFLKKRGTLYTLAR
ncbi:MAG: A/G-specific adenine glycosylase [bacterium]|nr:A/G-specific adenine glycosylase [bacterium]